MSLLYKQAGAENSYAIADLLCILFHCFFLSFVVSLQRFILSKCIYVEMFDKHLSFLSLACAFRMQSILFTEFLLFFNSLKPLVPTHFVNPLGYK